MPLLLAAYTIPLLPSKPLFQSPPPALPALPLLPLPAYLSVVFNFLGRDFFNALSEKDAEGFSVQIVRYLAGFVVGIPVFVFKSYYQVGHQPYYRMQIIITYICNRYSVNSANLYRYFF